MAILPCRCGASVNTERALRQENTVRCPDCGAWLIDPRDPEEVMAEQAAVRTWVEFYACPGCGATLDPVRVGALGTPDLDTVTCRHCSHLVDDGPTTERVYQQGDDGQYKPVDLERRAAHRAPNTYVVRDLRATARLMQRVPLSAVLPDPSMGGSGIMRGG